MKKNNIRKGFTMVVLVFVIVIIGILSAVALPKFMDSAKQAHNSVVLGFEGTLNRTVAPALWAKSIKDGKNGLISEYCPILGNYTDIPLELVIQSGCEFNTVPNSGTDLKIIFIDGDNSTTPKWKAI